MKKLFLALVVLFTVNFVNGQEYFNMNNNRNFCLNIGMNAIPGKTKTIFCPNMSISCFGLYFDANCGSSIGTGASNSMSIDSYMPEGRVLCWHIGYKSPITKRLSIYPMIGHIHISIGYCDGSNYTISDNGTIHNHYTELNTLLDDFDFGAGIDYSFPMTLCDVIISASYTKYTYSISLGIKYNFKYLRLL